MAQANPALLHSTSKGAGMTGMGGSGSPTFELLYSQHTQIIKLKKYLEL